MEKRLTEYQKAVLLNAASKRLTEQEQRVKFEKENKEREEKKNKE